ncbi:MAG: hypothetical protein D8M26_00760 [Ignavibacteriae bacterium]|nr:hypothetical protein [Ignavibacteriota bacterium]
MTEIQPEVLNNLEPFHTKIRNCIVEAVTHYQEKLADESAIISHTTKASYIRDFILENAMRAFANDPNVSIIKKRRMVVFLFRTNPSIVLKFKKFDKYNRVSYSRTFQAFNFTKQIEMFEDYGKTINLHAGYKWNETATQIECLIGFPDSERGHAWTVNITDSGIIQQVDTIAAEVTESVKPKVRLKVKQIKAVNE